jgi:HSP90 family molecular chaperone
MEKTQQGRPTPSNTCFGCSSQTDPRIEHASPAGHKRARTEDANDLAALLFEEACILDGEVPDDPAAFATRLNRLVVRGLAIP